MSRLSLLVPYLIQKPGECSVPLKRDLPEKLTYLDGFMDTVCSGNNCVDCPFYYAIPTYKKLTP